MITNFCRGVSCPIRNTCLRYTSFDKEEKKTPYSVMVRCTNQRKFVQDASRVNSDGKNITQI